MLYELKSPLIESLRSELVIKISGEDHDSGEDAERVVSAD